MGELGSGLIDELCARGEAELRQAELDCLAAGEPEPEAPALAQNTAGSAYVPKTARSTSQISCSVA